MALSAGKNRLSFDIGQFNFRDDLLGLFRGESQGAGEFDLERLEDLHLLPGITQNVEHFRQAAFRFFRSDRFQAVYKAFGAHIIDNHFGGRGLQQKTPTVRIQLPGATLTSYHTDGWYGHGAGVVSFWVPITEVRDGNTLYIARDHSASRLCQDDILARHATLAEINDIARPICEPFEGGYGDYVAFSSDMIHGAEQNRLGYTRLSFDFRIAPDESCLGNKPLTNYYWRDELTGENTEQGTAATAQKSPFQRGLSYSNACRGKSAKAQLMLVAAYAEAAEIGITINESEIVTLDYLPVLRHYISDQSVAIDCIITFGIDIFGGSNMLMESILDCVDQNDRALVFAAEGIVFNPGDDRQLMRSAMSVSQNSSQELPSLNQ